mgnify:CR=1 FL=1
MIEIQNFGWNAITISAAINILALILGAWGLHDQIKLMWKNGKTTTISTALNIAYLGMFTAFVIYGFWLHSGALMIQLVRVILLSVIIYGLIKFRGLSPRQWLGLTLLTVGLIFMVALPYKEWFFLGFTIVGGVAAADQPFQIWKNKGHGMVSLKLIFVYAIGGAAWLVYGLILGKVFIASMGLLYLILNSTSLVLSHIYRK